MPQAGFETLSPIFEPYKIVRVLTNFCQTYSHLSIIRGRINRGKKYYIIKN
jgi:hypothetical protein